MLAAQNQQTRNLLATLGGLVKQHLHPELAGAEWNHLAEAALHMAALGPPLTLEDADSESGSDDPAPPSQSAAHRAAKAPKARAPAPPPAPRPKLKKAAAAGPSKTIRKKRVTKAEKKQKRKRPLSGYNLFFGAVAAQIREEHPEEDFNERGRIAGGMWTALSEAEKQAWKDKAVEVNARKKEAEEAEAAAMALQQEEEESSGEEEEEAESSEEEDDE